MSDQNSYEAAKCAHDLNLRAAERALIETKKWAIIFNENADRNSQAAIRVVLATNGGAAVALLAFVGGLASRTNCNIRYLDMIVY
jgi:hypothetical protein